MAIVEMKEMVTRKKILPLVMALGNKIINEIGFVEKINNSVEWDEKQWEISPGGLAKTLVLSTFFDIRTPLTRLADRFEQIDLRFLIGEEAAENNFNSFNAGRALERIGKSNCNRIYETLALSAIQMNQIPLERYHSDTTTISFYGEYDICEMDLTEEEKAELLQIERGYNKDGRPQSKQLVLGQILNEKGIPLVSRPMDGSTSDVEWNKTAIEYLKQMQQTGFTHGIYVADSKLVSSGLVSNMMDEENRVRFISRCPSSFEDKLEGRMIKKAYEEGLWNELGQYHEGKNASTYRGISYTETVCGYPMRLLVVESSSLSEKVEEAIDKEKEKLMCLVHQLEKKTFACHADAAAEFALLHNNKHAALFHLTPHIEQTIKQIWPRGRHKADTQPRIEEKYKVIIEQVYRNEEACQLYRQNESSFVIISNVLEESTDQDLLAIYKGQQIVENSFRLLKEPQLASAIYLKNPARIEALTMILSLSLLIRAIIQYRLREGLRRFNDENPDTKLNVGWNDRELTNPTYKLLYEHSIYCYFEREDQDRYSFAWPNIGTKIRVETLLSLMDITVQQLLE